MTAKYIIALSILLLSTLAKAQFVDLGQDPASLKWREIKTEDFQLIYPDFFEQKAQRMANIYALLYGSANSLTHRPKKISMIIHAKGGISNGSVGWAPRKSDLYSTPEYQAGEAWLEHLCVHEFRHVVQFDKVNRGFTQLLYAIFGEQMVMAVAGLYLPMWFVEGDAVSFETAVGHIGRGRSPEFLNEMKAQVMEKKIYTYDKAVLGSFKDKVPDRYTLGYFLTASARVHYGNAIWADAVSRTGERSFGITPFATSLKKTLRRQRDSVWNTPAFASVFVNKDSVKKSIERRGAKKTIYYDHLTQLKATWESEAIPPVAFDTIETHNPYYTEYYSPTPTPDSRIIAYKKGFRESGAFVFIGDGKESIITRTGTLYDYTFAHNHGRILWSEYRPHPRWEHGGRMILCSYDPATGTHRSHIGKYNRFSPFRYGEMWGFVEVDDENRASIVVTDQEIGTEIFRINAHGDDLFLHPSSDEEEIVTVVQSAAGNYIESIRPASGERKKLTEPLRCEIDKPLKSGNNLYFRASFSGNNAIYHKDLVSGKVTNLLNTPFGTRFPQINGAADSLYFSFYTSDGYKPGKISTAIRQETPPSTGSFPLADSLRKHEGIDLSAIPDSVYSSTKYRKALHLFNPHSWGPMHVNQFDQEVDLGMIVYSQNKLSTLSLAAGYIYTNDYQNGAWMFNATYKAWWPTLSIDLKTGVPEEEGLVRYANHVDTLLALYKYRDTRGQLTVELPFNISRRNYYRSVNPYIRYNIDYINTTKLQSLYYYYNEVPVEVDRGNYLFPTSINDYLQVMEYGINIVNQSHKTVQEINPRWGQVIQGGFRHTPWKKNDLGKQWWITGYFYFPGLAPNHSLKIYGGYQDSQQIAGYGMKILAPRGISAYQFDLFSMRNTYEFPIFYPDWNIGPLAYFKSLKGGLFFDFINHRHASQYNFYSYGGELSTDCHFLRLLFPINIGVRVGYETQNKALFTDMILGIALSF